MPKFIAIVGQLKVNIRLNLPAIILVLTVIWTYGFKMKMDNLNQI